MKVQMNSKVKMSSRKRSRWMINQCLAELSSGLIIHLAPLKWTTTRLPDIVWVVTNLVFNLLFRVFDRLVLIILNSLYKENWSDYWSRFTELLPARTFSLFHDQERNLFAVLHDQAGSLSPAFNKIASLSLSWHSHVETKRTEKTPNARLLLGSEGIIRQTCLTYG